jgi:osmotically-inducible protein OsmY
MTQNFSKILITLSLAVLLTGAYVYASETNDRIETSAKQSYVFKTYLEKDAITINVKHGVVTLTGTVAEESHKSLAEETVANLPGVKSVTNKLKLEGHHPAKNSDEWIGLEVKTSLLFNRHVSAVNTQVAVAHGVVTLRGEAENQAQKDLTGEYAKDIQGVKEVKNEMTLPKVPNELIKHTEEMIDDASITAQVKLALMSHYSTSAFMTGVNTTNGVVTLTGKTDSEAAKDMAGKVTDDVKGVTKVINSMTVKVVVSKK